MTSRGLLEKRPFRDGNSHQFLEVAEQGVSRTEEVRFPRGISDPHRRGKLSREGSDVTLVPHAKCCMRGPSGGDQLAKGMAWKVKSSHRRPIKHF